MGLQALALLVFKRLRAGLRQPLGSSSVRRQRQIRSVNSVEVTQAPLECVAVTFDEALASHPLQRQLIVAGGGLLHDGEPTFDSRLLFEITQRAAAETATARQCAQDQKPPEARGLDVTASLEKAIEQG